MQYEYPLESQAIAFKYLQPTGQNLFSTHLDDSTDISFILVPSSSRQETAKEWTLELPFCFESYSICSQDDLLVVVEQGIR